MNLIKTITKKEQINRNEVKMFLGESKKPFITTTVRKGKEEIKGYKGIKDTLNMMSRKYEGLTVRVEVGKTILYFKGNKFSNELTKVFDEAAVKYLNEGHYFEKVDEVLRKELKKSLIKTFQTEITLPDLLNGLSEIRLLKPAQLDEVTTKIAESINDQKLLKL